MSGTNTASASKSARPLLVFAVAALFGGCARKPPAAAPAPQAAAVPAPPPDVEVVVTEAVAGPEEDTASFTKVFIDGKPAGMTPVAPRSQPRVWTRYVPAGNHLFRLEQWYLPAVGEWAGLDAQWQPPERFVRVEDGARATISLKFTDDGRRYEWTVSRRPIP